MDYRIKMLLKAINNVLKIITHKTQLRKFLFLKKLVTTPIQKHSNDTSYPYSITKKLFFYIN